MARTTKLIALLTAGTAIAGCAQTNPELAEKHNPSIYSIHQPVVQRTDYVIDLAASNGLSPAEAGRLRAWFDSMRLGYGDRIYVDETGGYPDAATRDAIADVAGAYGLLLNDGSPVTQGVVQPGTVRVVVSRTNASVPGCPDWSYAALPGAPVSTDSNYGCAINSNLAAMVADPNDLVLGQTGASSGDAATSSKAIKAYRDRVPTGSSGELKSEKSGGKQ